MTSGYRKGRMRREDIITAATAAYGESGYLGASLRDIAKRAGISHAGLLYYFPATEQLLAAVLERRDAEDARREHLTGPAGIAVLRGFVALVRHNRRHHGIVDLYGRLAAEAISPGHPAHDYFVRHYRDARALLRDAFRVLAAEGALRPGVDPDAAAVTMVALMDGLQVQWLTCPDDVDMPAALLSYLSGVLADPVE